MTGLWAWIRTEPVALAAVGSAIVTVAVSAGVGQGIAGTAMGAVELALGAVARSQVSPVAKVPPVAP